MVDVSDVTGYIPNIGVSGSMIVSAITWFVIVVVIGIGVGFGTYWFIRGRRFNNKIIIFEKVGIHFQPTKHDKAMAVKFGESGDSVFYLKKHKKYLPTPEIQTGNRTYWYAIRRDGEWINIGLEDIDEAMKLVKAKFLDKEMRYARVGLQRNLRERYSEPSFWTKYGGIIAYVSLILVTGIMMWLLFDKYLEILNEVTKTVANSNALAELQTKILSGLDRVCSGSGLAAA